MSGPHKKLEKLFEILGWLQIAGSFLIIGVGVGVILLFLISGVTGKIIGVVVGTIIFIIGIYIATKAYKGKGTMYVISRTQASPELDDHESDLKISEDK